MIFRGFKAWPFFLNTSKTRVRSSMFDKLTTARSCRATNLWCPSTSSTFFRYFWSRLAGEPSCETFRDGRFWLPKAGRVSKIKPGLYSYPFSWIENFRMAACAELTSRRVCCRCPVCDSVVISPVASNYYLLNFWRVMPSPYCRLEPRLHRPVYAW